jgi:hypothetical protein
LVYKLGRHPFTVEKAERYRYALLVNQRRLFILLIVTLFYKVCYEVYW